MNQLKKIRKNFGLSQEDVAKSLRISRQTYCNYENGTRTMKPDMLLKISQLYNISTDDILQGQAQEEPKDLGDRTSRTITRTISRTTRIPVFKSVSASTSFETVEDKDVLGWVDIPIKMTREGQTYFAIRVKDDFMSPDYKVGDVVIILQQSSCDNGEDCFVCFKDSEGMLATIRLNADGGMTFIMKNPRCPSVTYSQQQISNYSIKILGVAVEVRRTIKRMNTRREPYI